MSINHKYFDFRNQEEAKKDLGQRHLRSLDTINSILQFSKKKTIEEKSTFLDVGCGDGSFFKFLIERKINATGCDIDQVNFESDSLPYPDNFFSHVMLYSVIEHVNNSANLLTEIKRVLQTDGNLIIITPNFRFCYSTFYDDPTHIKPFTDVSIHKILSMYNYKNILVKPWTVNYTNFIWGLPFSFFYSHYVIPFKNDNSDFIPKILKGKSSTMVAVCSK